MATPNLIYIAGYGRSGSTLLDIILGSHPSILGLGELRHFFKYYRKATALCSCGEPLTRCHFWGPIYNDFESSFGKDFKKYNAIQDTIEGIRFSTKRPDIKNLNELERQYQGQICHLLGCILRNSPSPPLYLIDSSKSAYSSAMRPQALKNICGIPLSIIHLTRHPRAVVYSVKRAAKRNFGNGMRSALTLPALRGWVGWLSANSMAEKLSNFGNPTHYLRVKYEEIVNETDRFLGKMEEFLKLDFSQIKVKIKEGRLTNHSHLISGNRMRFQKEIYLKEDLEWQNEKSRSRLWALLMSRSIKKYGYPFHPQNPE